MTTLPLIVNALFCPILQLTVPAGSLRNILVCSSSLFLMINSSKSDARFTSNGWFGMSFRSRHRRELVKARVRFGDDDELLHQAR